MRYKHYIFCFVKLKKFYFLLQEVCNRPIFVQDGPTQFDITPGKMGKYLHDFFFNY